MGNETEKRMQDFNYALPFSELSLSDGFLFGEVMLYDSIVIFICTFDLFGKGRIFYTFKNTCMEEPGLVLPDGAVKIFLNTEGMGESEEDGTLVEFLRYVADKDSPVKSPSVKKIKRRVEEVKRNQETEARYMTSLTHAREIYEDGRAEGLAAGKIQSILDVLSELGDVPEILREKISKEENLETLGGWVKLAARVESAADFEQEMWDI